MKFADKSKAPLWFYLSFWTVIIALYALAWGAFLGYSIAVIRFFGVDI